MLLLGGDSSFFYLTGIKNPKSAVVLSNTKPRFILFIEKRDAARERWTGPMLDRSKAKRCYRADAVYLLEELEAQCKKIFGAHHEVFYPFESETAQTLVQKTIRSLHREVREGTVAPTQLKDASEIIAEMRLRKTREELAAMRKAQAITAEGFRAALTAVKPNRYEYEVLAELNAAFTRRGVISPAYPPIVCSGPKTCTLHCPTYDRKLRAGDLLLLDAGAQWDGYCADVTRTVPVSGKFTRAQRLMYDIVLEAQETVITKVLPGTRFDELEITARQMLFEGLRENKVLLPERSRGATDINDFFPHKIGHWLGLDVHDVGSYRDPSGDGWRKLEPGMMLTVEPGLYFPTGAPGVAREFLGIGIRIEDDLLVTRTSHDILSKAIPKKPPDLERLRRSSARRFHAAS